MANAYPSIIYPPAHRPRCHIHTNCLSTGGVVFFPTYLYRPNDAGDARPVRSANQRQALSTQLADQMSQIKDVHRTDQLPTSGTLGSGLQWGKV